GSAAADFGAVEFDPRSDYARLWPRDFDGDGSPFGIEWAVGTDIAVADRASPRNFRVERPAAGGVRLRFGRSAAAESLGTSWSIEFSTTPDTAWQTVYGWSLKGEFVADGFDVAIERDSPEPGLTSLVIPIAPPAGFYRLVTDIR